MEDMILLKNITQLEDVIVPTLFKPIQFRVITRLSKGKSLSDNEKRYFRGRIKQKLVALKEIIKQPYDQNELTHILNSIGIYYITGLEALKHNGFGWYYQTKIVEIINTKIQGKIHLSNMTLRFIRVKTIKKKKYKTDKKTGLKYATNEQILKDVTITKNTYAKKLWIEMLSRYKRMFVRRFDKFKNYIQNQEIIDFSKYGV